MATAAIKLERTRRYGLAIGKLIAAVAIAVVSAWATARTSTDDHEVRIVKLETREEEWRKFVESQLAWIVENQKQMREDIRDRRGHGE